MSSHNYEYRGSASFGMQTVPLVSFQSWVYEVVLQFLFLVAVKGWFKVLVPAV